AIIEQRVALGRSTVSGDLGAAMVVQKTQEGIPDAVDPGLEVFIDLPAAKAEAFLDREQGIDPRRAFTPVVRMGGANPQRTPVRRKFFDVEHVQALGAEDTLGRIQGQEGKVLVIEGVELDLLDEPKECREYERNDTAGL